MRRVVSSLVLAAAFAVFTSANASAGLFGGLLCKGGCDSGCAEPACGVEAPCAPACEPACGLEPACGCEAPACDSGCGIKKPGLLSKLFSKKSCLGCEAPACGCAEPACGCEPSCGF
jgi:hypothetical protein